ncbi:META domain-containing protein [Yoonia sp. MH D7]
MLRAILLLVLLAACWGDESVSAYAPFDGDYAMVSLDGAPFGGVATINVSQVGKVTGRAPCNSYFADQLTDYPWFEVGPIGATRMACPDLPLESAFFAALGDMTLAEAHKATLILSNTAGREMVFQVP